MSKETMNQLGPKEYPELDYLEFFTTPFHLNSETDKSLLEELPERRYSHAVVVGRFQPLHYGHIYLMKQALRMASIVTIGIGSANVTNEDNPFLPEQREYMVRKALKKEGATSRIKKIVYLDDDPDDNIWIEKAKERIGDVSVVVGNNDWVNNCFISAGISAVEVPLLQRGIYEGKKIRAFLRETGKL